MQRSSCQRCQAGGRRQELACQGNDAQKAHVQRPNQGLECLVADGVMPRGNEVRRQGRRAAEKVYRVLAVHRRVVVEPGRHSVKLVESKKYSDENNSNKPNELPERLYLRF